MIISTNAEKAFDKVQHPLMNTTLSEVEVEAAFLNIINAIILETYSQHHTQWAKI